ncbi:hypothetical protein EGT81_19500 [Alcaligenes faecalis]|uniref:PD-(D/E)XK nuclease family protein n=1 Tax=Alcaligenes faecalis TaxID=511 RepID=UPI000F678EEC|nr:hypothetical protein [Alcaligenes faecalis]RSE57623.1 hypothetical protein EGT81_19500 [Alcaligenes faecalis]
MNPGNTSLIVLAATVLVVLMMPIVLGRADCWRHERNESVGKWFVNEKMPAALRNATLYMNERTLAMQKPVRLNAKVDQVYRKRNGLLVLVETKTRNQHRVYDSDIYQLSLYALILSIVHKQRVSHTAYVRTVIGDSGNRSVRYHLVRLISPATLLRQLP